MCFKLIELAYRQIVKRKFTVFVLFCFTLYLRAISKYKPPAAYIPRDKKTEGFLHYKFGGFIFGGAYFRNFMVFLLAAK